MASFFFIDKHSARVDSHKATPLPVTPAVVKGAAPADSGLGDWATTSAPRTEVRPPSLFARSQPVWRRWMVSAWNWLWDDENLEDHPRVVQSLNQIKTEFLATVWDLQSYNAAQVRENVTHARSLRELWHLRADVFRVIAVHRGQAEANRRLDALNRHFPVKVSAPAAVATPAGRVSQW